MRWAASLTLVVLLVKTMGDIKSRIAKAQGVSSKLKKKFGRIGR